LPFVVTTEPCLRSTLDRAVATMASMDFMLEAPLVLEILVEEDLERD
jgi:homoserine dehydrogenase